jgi:hypothetical protein
VTAHFARPLTFGDQERDVCTECGEAIMLYTNPDGHRVWRHVVDVLREMEP